MKKGELYVLFSYLFWGLTPVYWKLLAGVSSAYVLANRMVWSFVLCLFLLIIRKDLGSAKEILKDSKQRRMVMLCGIFITINWGVYIFTVASGHIVEASLAYYINPLFAAILGAIAFKEKMSKFQLLSIVIAFAGVMVSVIGLGEVPWFAIIIAISFAIYGALKKRVKASAVTGLYLETMYIFIPALGFIIWSGASGTTQIQSMTGLEIVLLVFSGAVTSFPLILYAKGMKETSMTMSGILMYINPTMQLLFGVIVYHEPFTKTTATTFILVWIAVILFVADSIRRQKQKNKMEA